MMNKYMQHFGIIVVGTILLSVCSAYMSGNMKLAQKNYDAAIEHFHEDLAQNPDHWQARVRLGYAYLQTGQFDKAIEELTRALQQEPGDADATYYLGLAWLKKGDRAKAIDIWHSYENPGNPELEQALKRQVTLLEMSESLHLAKLALADEGKLQVSPPAPNTVAVFYFKDISPDNSYRHLQKALAAMVITDLSNVQSLQVLERSRIQALLTEMQLGQTGIVAEQTAPRAGRLLGAESLVVGTFEPGSLVVKSNVASTSQQDVVGGFSVTGEEQEFFGLQKEIVYNLLDVLRVSLTAEEEALVGKYHTKNFKAITYYGQALDALDAGNWEEARNFFRKALSEDPDFFLARVGLNSCPDAAAPSIGQLGTMSTAELAALTENALTEVEAAHEDAARSITGVSDTSSDEGETEGEATGSVSVGW
jgi:tetratricopeptide (TPR) repeat protein